MPLLSRKAIILGKIESVYGTDAAPTGAANAILASNLNLTPIAAEFVDRDNLFPYLGHADSVLAAKSVQLAFEVEIAGAGAAGDAPKWGPLLRACGFGETIDAGVDVRYAPISAAFPSVTIHFNQDGVLHKLLGARGNVRFRFPNRQVPKLAFEFTGLDAAVTDAAAPTPDFAGFVKPLAVNYSNSPTFTLHAVASPTETVEIDMANVVAFRSLIGAELVHITDRRPAGTISMEATTVATKDWWTTIKAGTLGALNLVHGVGAGHIVQVQAPNVQIMNPRYEDSEGIAMLAGDLRLVPGAAGNDEILITVK